MLPLILLVMVSDFSLEHLILSAFIYNVDINECSPSSNICDQICTNTIGSYLCSCYTGFNLLVSGNDCLGEHVIFY